MNRSPHQPNLPYYRNSIHQKQPPQNIDRNKENIILNIPSDSNRNFFEVKTNLREHTHQRYRSDYHNPTTIDNQQQTLTLEILNDKINRLTIRVTKNEQVLQVIGKNQPKIGSVNNQQLMRSIEECWKQNIFNKQAIENENRRVNEQISLLREQIIRTQKGINQPQIQTICQQIEIHLQQTAKNLRIEIARNTQDFFKKYINQLNTLKQQVNFELQALSNKLHQTWNFPLHNLTQSSKKYPFEPISIVLTQNLTAPNSSNKKFQPLSQKIYYLDNEGYLLDDQNHYLVDSNAQQVRLSKSQIQILKNKIGV